jgi:phage terminase large subunit GpA-like protein
MATATKRTPREIDEAVEGFDRTLEYLVSFHAIARPPSNMRLSEWANLRRILSSESSAEPGPWVTDKAPYEREIMDAISDPFTERVAVQKAAQVGITDSAVLNPIGYFAEQDPCPILVVQPTIEMAETFSTDRLAPMIRDSPNVRACFSEARSRDTSNTLRRKAFRGGFVAIGGANSAASLSGRPVRVVLLDDVDRYPASAGSEGNPLQLAIARTSAFWNRKIVIISSPGIKGVSHIEREMAESTQEHWYLPCPRCAWKQILVWDRIRFADVTHECIECGKFSEKFEYLAGKGEWRAHRPVDSRGRKVRTRGFYISGLYNPWIDWEILIEEFVRAARANEEGDVEPLKAFRNTRLGQLHEDTGEKVDVDLYGLRREVYKAEIPDGVLVLTAGVDVGERQLNYEIVGWGKENESWGIEYGILDGDPREQDVWNLLDQAVYRREFTTSDGMLMRVRKVAVDSNYASDFVYAYTKPRQPRAISVRGEGGLGKPFIKGAGTLTKSNRARLFTLGVDSGKEEITNRLMVMKPGPGYCHFPCEPQRGKREDGAMANEPTRGYDEEYFKGLTAERRIVKAKLGFKTYIWIKRLSQRNEPFDCRNYALGALRMPFSGMNLNTMKRDDFSEKDRRSEREIGVPFGAHKERMFGAQGVTMPPQEQSQGKRFGAQNKPIF